MVFKSENALFRPGVYLSWWKSWKTLPVAPWVRAADCFRNGDFRTAIAHYETGLASNKSHSARPCALFDLSYCRYRIGLVEEAAESLHELVSERVKLKEVYLLLAKIQLVFGHNQGAVVTLQIGSELFPHDIGVAVALAYASFRGHEQSEEMEAVRRKLDIIRKGLDIEDTNRAKVDTAIATYEIRFGDAVVGERILARLLASGDAPAEAVLLRGEFLLNKGRVVPARGQLRRAMALKPQDPRPVLLLAESYLRPGGFGDVAWAKQLAEAACRLSTWRNADALGLLALACGELGDEEFAEFYRDREQLLRSATEIDLQVVRKAGSQIELLRSLA